MDGVAAVDLARRIVRAQLAGDPRVEAPFERRVAKRVELLRIGDEIVQRRAEIGVESLVVMDRKENGKEPPPSANGDGDCKTSNKKESGDILRRVYFRAEIRPEDLPKSFKASLTLRAGIRTFTARTSSGCVPTTAC